MNLVEPSPDPQPDADGPGEVLPLLLDVLSAGHDAVFAVNPAQSIIYWSPQAERVLGFSAREVLGKPCHEVLSGAEDDGRPFCRSNCPAISAVRRNRGVPAYDVRSSTRDGQDCWLNVSILPLPRSVAGEPIAVHLFRDVTNRRQAEALAQQVLAAVQTFQGGTEMAAPAGPDRSRATPSLLTGRELEVLHHLARGASTANIAESLEIATGTVRNHIEHILRKLGVNSRLEATVEASRLGLV